MTDPVSPFYPPRAPWYRALYRPWFALRRTFQLEKIESGLNCTLHGFLLGCAVPGYAFWLSGRKQVAKILIGSYVLLGLIFLVWLGQPASHLAFGLMIGLHAISIAHQLCCWLDDLDFRGRIALVVFLLAVLWFVVYRWPVRQIEKHLAIPIVNEGKVFLVKPSSNIAAVKRGDWVAYVIPEQGWSQIRTRAGISLEKVLATAGDHVRFTDTGMEVNGQIQPSDSLMPREGELTIEPNHWFIWPRLEVSNRNVPGDQITAAVVGLAQVSEKQFKGKPYARWFWRRQTLP
jgi:Signal peptidase, peptidase S26